MVNICKYLLSDTAIVFLVCVCKRLKMAFQCFVKLEFSPNWAIGENSDFGMLEMEVAYKTGLHFFFPVLQSFSHSAP